MLIFIITPITVFAGGYFRFTLYLDEYPTAGNKPYQLTCDKGNDYITYQAWNGNFDENGCFIAGQYYTLTAECTIKEGNRQREEFDTTPGKFELEFSVLGDYNDYICDIVSLSKYVVRGEPYEFAGGSALLRTRSLSQMLISLMPSASV